MDRKEWKMIDGHRLDDGSVESTGGVISIVDGLLGPLFVLIH